MHAVRHTGYTHKERDTRTDRERERERPDAVDVHRCPHIVDGEEG